MKAEHVFDCDAVLGEGASWDVERQRLWWVDILGRQLFCGDPATGRYDRWAMDTEIGAAVAAPGGRRALVLRDRVELFMPETGAREAIWQGDEAPTNRFNDAGVDRHGALWIGSMDFDATAPTGILWRIGAGGDARRVADGISVMNGPVFAPNGSRLYFCDTMAGRVLALDLDPATGHAIGAPRLHIELGGFGGLADGMAIDAEGCLWLARVTAGRVTRYRPDGTPDLTLAVPVPMTTSVAFGGADLKTLFVTTGRIIMDETDLTGYPASGSVYAFRVDVAGMPEHMFLP